MLRRKMFRDMRLNLSQFITIFLMVLIGVMAYSGIEAYMSGMEETKDKFYKNNNLQDLNVTGTNFSTKDLEDIKSLDYVNDAERKLTVTATTNNDNTLSLNFIETNNISELYILKGEEFSSKSGIWLDNFYAIENNINIHDKIEIKYDGYVFKEEVLGLINVPDHLYDVKDEAQLYPDHKDFGFAYLSSSELEDYLKYKVAKEKNISEDVLSNMNFNYKDYLVFNTIMVDVNAKKNVSKVKDEIEENIDSALAIIKIEDTSSYKTYQGEIDEGKTYVGVFSGLFIFIAMLSVVTTMNRVIKKQRMQIGTLKALGFKKRKVTLHYIGYGFYVSLFGSIIGLLLGYFGLGKMFIGLEMSFFEIPNGTPVMNTSSYICAVLVVLLSTLVTYLTCRRELNKTPAETLRVESPKIKGKSLNITTKGIFKKMSFNTIWNIRDMIRSKARTITGIMGITGCCILIVCAFGMLDSMHHFVKLQFEDLYNFDYKLTLKENLNKEQLKSLTDKYGNNTSESYLIEIKDKDGNKESNNIFVTDAKDYVRFVNNKGKFISIDNDSGVYITYKLASEKGYKIGDNITWHMVGNKKYYTSKIVGFNKDPQNQNMTMTRKYYESLGNTYKADSLYTNINLSNVKSIDNVSLIQDKDALKDGMNNMLSMMRSMIVLIIVIAIILGIIIIYNMGILSFSEKQYQFATLKVLGFKNKQIKKIFIKQNSIIAVISIILGLPLGYFLTDYLFKEAIEEHYDFSAYITIPTYVYAIIGTYLVCLLVSLYLSKRIKNIDMVSSLKGNE